MAASPGSRHGRSRRRRSERRRGRRRPVAASARRKKPPNYTAVFAAELIELAQDRPADRRRSPPACRPAPASRSSRPRIPERFIDVGIAEQHAVTMATGLAIGGMRPVVALYSTFLQRAFDQTVHDVCQNDLPVLLAVDRAGLVGEDGTSHQGMFTLPGPAPAAESRRSRARRTSRSSAR